MTPNSLFKYKFTYLLLLVGFVTSAQNMCLNASSTSGNELSVENLRNSTDKKLTGCLEYSGYVVSRETGNPIPGASIEIKYSVSGLVKTIIADQNGYYQVIMPCNEKSKMVFVGKGYSEELHIVKTGENHKRPSKNNRIYLTPFNSLVENDGSVEKIKVDPIFFDSDEPTTVAWDKMTLDKVLFAMLKFPEIRIKIESHSNAGGTDISNAVLSYFHAKDARRYLILQGIDADRIESATGFGTGHSENDCANGIDCDNQKSSDSAHSDFIIVSN